MKSVLIVDSASPSVPDLAADLTAVGIQVLGVASRGNLVRESIRLAPTLIVGHEVSLDDGLFDAFSQLAATAPCAVAVFTNDPDFAKIERALRSGIHVYVVNGYGLNRLRSVLHVAEARFEHERALRTELADIGKRFDERKLVDRAKGILMRARQVSEEEAFRVLRTASMHSQRRVSEISKQVIDAAHYADAVNRAGKLRMLTQRLVKLSALQQLEPRSARIIQCAADSVTLLDANIAALAKSLSKATFGDLLETVDAAWPPLRELVAAQAASAGARARPAEIDNLVEIDRLAEHLLTQADQLTRHLETAGLVTTLHVINVSGRQRMLSQRFAKQALLGQLLSGAPAQQAQDDMAKTAVAFEQALAYLKTIPLGTREIRESLGAAEQAWRTLAHAGRQIGGGAGLRGSGGSGGSDTAGAAGALSDSSEELLALFEGLTDKYECSMQVLMG